MRKLVVAGMLCLAAVSGSGGQAFSMSLFGHHLGLRDDQQEPATPPPAPLNEQVSPNQSPVLVQSSDAEVRLQQLEDQMRQLNGRVEEMSFQLLQMQEQMRKTQEDNEFRFQSLEKKGGASGATATGSGVIKKSEADAPPAAAGSKSDDIARVIETPAGSDMPAATSKNNGLGQPASQLGSIQFDQNGSPVGTKATQANNGSGPAPASSAGDQTASLGNEGDMYKAAYGHVLSGDYGVAEKEFRQYIGSYPETARSPDANFWLGEALYSQGKYNDAATTFVNAYKKYGTSEKAPEMLLKLGMSLAALDNKDTACATLHEVTKKYPKASKPVVTKVASEEKRLAC
jgi:tol-pal system protein YbgF